MGRDAQVEVNDQQIVARFRETNRNAFRKRHGVNEQTIYTWKTQFGSFQHDDMRRLKQLEQENARLKELIAERDLEIEVMKEIAQRNSWACWSVTNRRSMRRASAGSITVQEGTLEGTTVTRLLTFPNYSPSLKRAQAAPHVAERH